MAHRPNILVYKDPLLNYLLVTVPSILTLRYIKWGLGYIHSKSVASQLPFPRPRPFPRFFWIIWDWKLTASAKKMRLGCACFVTSLKINRQGGFMKSIWNVAFSHVAFLDYRWGIGNWCIFYWLLVRGEKMEAHQQDTNGRLVSSAIMRKRLEPLILPQKKVAW